METFDHFKKQDPSPEDSSAPETEYRPSGPNVLEIAKLISSGDEAVLKDVSVCTEDPVGWFTAHQDRYRERCILSSDDPELIQWLGLVDILEEHGWVCERDWEDELEDFSYFLQNLHGFQKLGLELDPDWLDEDEDVSAWCGVLTGKWEGVCVAAIDIDSDSYVLFLTSAAQLADLQRLAGEIGHRIDAAERM
ncbi:hypothetical protein D7V91_02155 [bacterium 1xD42-67]|nr:hypothetical protein D7V91_02155 [bacterium 1xD42-67]